jgi:hypothetical protein
MMSAMDRRSAINPVSYRRLYARRAARREDEKKPTTQRMPVVFLAHGRLRCRRQVAGELGAWGNALPGRGRSSCSAHWDASPAAIGAIEGGRWSDF